VPLPVVFLVLAQADTPQSLNTTRTGWGPCGFGSDASPPVGLAVVQVMVLASSCVAFSQGTESPSHTMRFPAALVVGKEPRRVRCVPPSVEPLAGLTEVRRGVRVTSNVKLMPGKVCRAAPCGSNTEQQL
jgi:hypothetical protein